MRSNIMKAITRAAALTGVLMTVGVSSASAIDVYLQAEPFSKNLVDSDSNPVETVSMWGWASCTDDTFTSCALPTSPGLQIDATSADVLTFHVSNALVGTPVSIVMPGLPGGGGGDPTFFTDGQGRSRVQSMTHEVAAGGTGTYTFDLTGHPGTYLYQSGTYPSIQVPMGLYGAVVVTPTVDACAGAATSAYDDDGSCFGTQALLLFSEVDPWMNGAIDGAAGDTSLYPATVDYEPSYLLVNGELAPPTPSLALGDTALLRMLNAGLRAHSPSIAGLELDLIAEDGHRYPGNARRQTSVLLAPGKTLDALVSMPMDDTTFALYDRMPQFSFGNQPGGGLLTQLDAGLGSADPVPFVNLAVADNYFLDEETALFGVNVVTNDDPSIQGGAVQVVNGPAHAMFFQLLGNGSLLYIPAVDFSGTDTFTYNVSVGGLLHSALVTIDVTNINDPAVGNADAYVNTIGPNITVAAPGVLGNDIDVDGDVLTVQVVSPPASGILTLAPDGSFTFTGGTPGDNSFTYEIFDGTAWSVNAVDVELTINPVANIQLIVADPQGNTVNDYRWLVQEDATHHIDPANPPTDFSTIQATTFHKSYMPVIVQGRQCPAVSVTCPEITDFADVALDPAKYYYVSVLPMDASDEGAEIQFRHTMGGAQVLAPGGTFTSPVQVMVNPQPIATAQVSVQVFEDNSPTNGVPDPGEPGLGGFEIVLEDAGGRYGISGGQMLQNVFGEPLSNSIPCFDGAAPASPGVIVSCPDTPANQALGIVGQVLIKDLPPAKYGVIAVPRANEARNWTQTSTIEGTKVVDAWVMANEPSFFVEFGGPGPHVFLGFVNPEHTVAPVPGTNTIRGRVTLLHDPRPPGFPGLVDSNSFNALGHTRAWVGLNSDAGIGDNIGTVHAVSNESTGDQEFEITGVPDGTHQLVIWDDYLDIIIGFQAVTVAGGVIEDVGNVAINAWFSRVEHNVYLDQNGNGIREVDELPLQEQAINLRFRDGSVYQSFPTDLDGFVPFDQAFPFFHWLVAEVDYTRFEPTGLTVTVDGGAETAASGPYEGILSYQDQDPGPGFAPTRTELGPVLTEGFQIMPGQTSVFDWGKRQWLPGTNGGISGIVYYASTRGENDPRLTAGDPWEAGIPGIKVRLYQEIQTTGGPVLSLLEEAQTDSWDDALPEGCPGEDVTSPFVTQTLGVANLDRCYDGWRNWNQTRPGVFDGGYAFNGYPPGEYIVEVVVPEGYELYKEEDVNVGYGDVFAMAPVDVSMFGMGFVELPDGGSVGATFQVGVAQPPCVGEMRTVPDQLSLFPTITSYAPFAGIERPLCDRKKVHLADQGQAAADFHLFTSTPVAAQFTGLITDDVSNEVNLASPGYGERWSPDYMPFSIRDFNGHEVYRGYSDTFGHYNGVVASTFSAHIPIPSGYSPAMYSVCLNDPGDGPALDPYKYAAYSTFCYTQQFMPATTTYLDTPVIPQSAFAANYSPPDCALPEGTPGIAKVLNLGNDRNGTYRSTPANNQRFRIQSQGIVTVPNPAYAGPLADPPFNVATVDRDFTFGPGGTARLVNEDLGIDQILDVIGGWDPLELDVRSRAAWALPTGEYQLIVTRSDNGRSSLNSVTMTYAGGGSLRRVAPGQTIQSRIDASSPGDLVLVDPGVYNESVVMWKPVRLQGAGTDTIINGIGVPTESLAAWQDLVDRLVNRTYRGIFQAVDILPGQNNNNGIGFGPGLLGTEMAAGITVLGKNGGPNSFNDFASRIDGLTVTNADGGAGGGGIFVNGYAHNLQISNNNVTANSGVLHGGIRVGHPFIVDPAQVADDGDNDGPYGFNNNLKIHHNAITLNGSLGEQSAGGGLAICTGTDNYTVSNNLVCGNFTTGAGAGIGHIGLSDNGLIAFNEILFNQSVFQGASPSGGGIFVGGESAGGGVLSLGSGDVTIDGNLIQGNQAGSGHGGGIRAEFVNGRDVFLDPNRSNRWFRLVVTNNMIVNNVAGWSGAGISLQDVAFSDINLNTVANNDSTATVGALVVGNLSERQPAGVSSALHSAALAAVIPVHVPGTGMGPARRFADYSNPWLMENILWHNRAFAYDATTIVPGDLTSIGRLVPQLPQAFVGECPAGAVYWDFGGIDPGVDLNPRYSILTDRTGEGQTNSEADPMLVSEYCNGRREIGMPGEMLQAIPAFEEGGNYIDVRYGPLTRAWPAETDGGSPWDYHILAASPAFDYAAPNGNPVPDVGVVHDFDDQGRPYGGLVDVGADELPVGSAPPVGGGGGAGGGDGGGGFAPPPPPPIGDGVCLGGNNPGAACAEDSDCPPNGGPGEGQCGPPGTPPGAVLGDGTCVGGNVAGSPCFEDSDCPPNGGANEGYCQ